MTTGTPPALAAKRTTNTIPIVMASAGNPVGVGLVSSLARPGGNVTGMASSGWELAGKRLELLRELVPKLDSLALLWDRTNPANMTAVRETREARRRFFGDD